MVSQPNGGCRGGCDHLWLSEQGDDGDPKRAWHDEFVETIDGLPLGRLVWLVEQVELSGDGELDYGHPAFDLDGFAASHNWADPVAALRFCRFLANWDHYRRSDIALHVVCEKSGWDHEDVRRVAPLREGRWR